MDTIVLRKNFPSDLQSFLLHTLRSLAHYKNIFYMYSISDDIASDDARNRKIDFRANAPEKVLFFEYEGLR